jgi:ADP-dependent NAD(P)H-hydrate dehydratase / NAD(P)H-hydrate epimerase
MVAAEQEVFDQGISVDALMLRAGQGAAEMIWRIGGAMPTLVLCGPGNNGGDGYVIAEFLRLKNVPVTVAALCDPRTDAASQARANYHGDVAALADATPHAQLVDCLFGSGLTRALDAELWRQFSGLVRHARRSFAIDLPSCADADRAVWFNAPLKFDHVLALGAWKYAHLLEPVASECGTLSLIEIGVAPHGVAVSRLAKPRIAAPDATSHKYRRGLVAVLAGAMPGAALLAARAAQASGAGYVKLIGAGEPPAMLPADLVWERADDAAAVAERLEDDRIGAVLIGPGLGRTQAAATLLGAAIASDHPLVIDADALHLLGPYHGALAQRSAPIILTPHHGEVVALADAAGGLPDARNKIERAQALAAAWSAHIVYKGADSVIASPDGQAVIADRRCAWLSVAGTGDILAGCVAARLASHRNPLTALTQAVWLHDRAAWIAGPAFSALELAGTLPRALEACLDR